MADIEKKPSDPLNVDFLITKRKPKQKKSLEKNSILCQNSLEKYLLKAKNSLEKSFAFGYTVIVGKGEREIC